LAGASLSQSLNVVVRLGPNESEFTHSVPNLILIWQRYTTASKSTTRQFEFISDPFLSLIRVPANRERIIFTPRDDLDGSHSCRHFHDIGFQSKVQQIPGIFHRIEKLAFLHSTSFWPPITELGAKAWKNEKRGAICRSVVAITFRSSLMVSKKWNFSVEEDKGVRGGGDTFAWWYVGCS
jgi:hypothetical protein